METLKKSLSKSNKELNFNSLNNMTSNLQNLSVVKNSNLVDVKIIQMTNIKFIK